MIWLENKDAILKEVAARTGMQIGLGIGRSRVYGPYRNRQTQVELQHIIALRREAPGLKAKISTEIVQSTDLFIHILADDWSLKSLSKKFFSKRYRTNDVDFDSHFLVSGEPDTLLKCWLSSAAVRRRLVEAYPCEISLRNGSVVIDQISWLTIPKTEGVIFLLNLAIELARVMDNCIQREP